MPVDPPLESVRDAISSAMDSVRNALAILAKHERAVRNQQREVAHQLAQTTAGTTLLNEGMTLEEAAAVLAISSDRVRSMLRRGHLSGIQFGGRIGWRIDRQQVNEAAERREAQRRGRVLAANQRLLSHAEDGRAEPRASRRGPTERDA